MYIIVLLKYDLINAEAKKRDLPVFTLNLITSIRIGKQQKFNKEHTLMSSIHFLQYNTVPFIIVRIF